MADVATLGLKVESQEVERASDALDRLDRASQSAERSTDQLSRGSDRARRSVDGVASSSQTATTRVNALAAAARTAGAALVAAFSVRSLANYADSWSDMQSVVGAAIGDMSRAGDMMSRITDIANASYAPLEQTAQIYASNVGVLRDLGRSADEAADFTESLNNMLVLTATRGQQAESVQNALSRAMAVGRLQAQGLETILANGGEVAQALANELGTTVNGLRALASQGKITGDVIANAIIGALDDVRERAMEMPATIGDGFIQIRNSTLQLVGELDQALGASERVADSLVGFAHFVRGTLNPLLIDNADVLRAVGGGALAVAAAYTTLAAAKMAATVATRLFTAALRVNPVVAAATAVVALAGALYSARDAMVTFGDTTASVMDWMRGAWLATSEIVATEMGAALQSSEGYWGAFTDYLGRAWNWITVTFSALMTSIGEAAKSVVNWQIGLWLSVGDVVAITARTIREAFANAFDNILNIGRGFWESLTQILSGNFNFQPFYRALRQGITDPLEAALVEARDAIQSRMSGDYLGTALEIASGHLTAFGEAVSDYAFQSRMLRGEVEGAAESLEALGLGAGGATGSLGKLVDEASKGKVKVDEFARALQAQEDQLFPVEAAQRRYREEQAILTRAWNEGRISAERYTEAMRRLELAQLSAQTPGQAYSGIGFGAQIGSRQDGMGASPQETQGYWDRWLESAGRAFTDFDQMAADVAENFSRGFGTAFERMIFDSESAGDAARGMLEGVARSTINALGQMAGQWVAYQAVQMATGRSMEAAAVGSAAITGTAIASAYAPAAAAVSLASFGANAAPAMAGMSSTFALGKTLALTGMAHDGIDRVPREGTWLLDRGERVMRAPQADRLDQYLDRQERRTQQGQPSPPQVNIYMDGKDRPQVETRFDQRDERWVINVVSKSYLQEGTLHKVHVGKYGSKSRGI